MAPGCLSPSLGPPTPERRRFCPRHPRLWRYVTAAAADAARGPGHSTSPVAVGPGKGLAGSSRSVPVTCLTTRWPGLLGLAVFRAGPSLCWEAARPPCCSGLAPGPTRPAPAPTRTGPHRGEPYLVDLFKPPVDAIEGPAVCDVVDQDHALGRGVRRALPDRSARGAGPGGCAGARPRARDQWGASVPAPALG